MDQLDLSYRALTDAKITREMAFSREEYDNRVAKVRKAMAEQEIDVLLVHHLPNFCYLAGFQCPLANWYACLILPLQGEPIAHVVDFEVTNLTVHGWEGENIHTLDWRWQVDAPGQLVSILRDEGYANKRIGLEFRLPGCSAHTYRALLEGLPNAEVVDASDLVLDIRAVKSPAEQTHIREAARLTDIGMQAALGATAEGKRDNDIFAAAVEAMAKAGSEYLSIQPLVYVGPWTSLPHLTAKRRTLKRGETASMELTAAYQRYAAPLQRTAVVGEPSDLIRRLADNALARLALLYENARPGRAASEVARAVDEKMKGKEPAGASGWWMEVYSVGIGFPPDWVDHAAFISERHDRVLEPGMVFHTPAGCQVLNQVEVTFSETILITETGNEPLSQLPRELTVV